MVKDESRRNKIDLLCITKSKGHGGKVTFSVGFGEPGSSETEESGRMDAVVEPLKSGLVLQQRERGNM